MEDSLLKQEILNRVITFCTKWNEVEAKYHELGNTQEKLLNRKTDIYEDYGDEIEPIFRAYCTDKKRVYGGPRPRYFGYPTKFHNVEVPLKSRVEIKSKSRAEIYITRDSYFHSKELLFIVLKKAGEWKIDSYKQLHFIEENVVKWSNSIL